MIGTQEFSIFTFVNEKGMNSIKRNLYLLVIYFKEIFPDFSKSSYHLQIVL